MPHAANLLIDCFCRDHSRCFDVGHVLWSSKYTFKFVCIEHMRCGCSSRHGALLNLEWPNILIKSRVGSMAMSSRAASRQSPRCSLRILCSDQSASLWLCRQDISTRQTRRANRSSPHRPQNPSAVTSLLSLTHMFRVRLTDAAILTILKWKLDAFRAVWTTKLCWLYNARTIPGLEFRVLSRLTTTHVSVFKDRMMVRKQIWTSDTIVHLSACLRVPCLHCVV